MRYLDRGVVRATAIVLFAASLSFKDHHAVVRSSGSGRDGPPNLVLIVTDDQRFDTLWAMPALRRLIADRGVRFVNGYVVNPICCPSRASLLTGDYSHTTGVYANRDDQGHGGFSSFIDRNTIATALQRVGYATGLFGKYLNGYVGPYIPPGWDRWFATYGGSVYYDYTAVDQQRLRSFGEDPSVYGTKVLADEAVAFIRRTDASQPLFEYVAPHAPHEPAIPAPGDGHAFATSPPWRPPSYNEANVSDKPAYVRANPKLDAARTAWIDHFRLLQLRTLLGVDRLVERIIHALAETDRIDNSLIVFTSDNGLQWGEHRRFGKGMPYEESVRVPFLVRFDGVVVSPLIQRALVLNIDVAPTFADAAGVWLGPTDGRSLMPLLRDPLAHGRGSFLIEHLGRPSDVPTFCEAHGPNAVLVWYGSNEREFYDLRHDPAELTNLAGTPRMMPQRRRLADVLRELCEPPPPGMDLPDAVAVPP